MMDTLTRRAFLQAGGIGVLLAGGLRPARAAVTARAPFALGIASGEPTHQSTVLWTRLATGLADGGGMAGKPIQVKWQIASDPGMRDIVKRGVVKAHPASAHTVRVPISGLPPDAWYWYQFGVGSDWSPIGRTRTFPKPGSDARRLKFAFVSCQHFESGFYTAYEHLAQEDLDFVVHLGDYIYEGGASAGGVRQHIGEEIVTLADYRARHAQYRSDPISRPRTPDFPSSSPGTTTRSRTTTPAPSPRTTTSRARLPYRPRSSCDVARTLTRPTSSTCPWRRRHRRGPSSGYSAASASAASLS